MEEAGIVKLRPHSEERAGRLVQMRGEIETLGWRTSSELPFWSGGWGVAPELSRQPV